MDSDDIENDNNWHSLPIEKVLVELKANNNGLTKLEVKKRIKVFGPNIIETKESFTYRKRYMTHFNRYLILILLSAILVSTIIEK